VQPRRERGAAQDDGSRWSWRWSCGLRGVMALFLARRRLKVANGITRQTISSDRSLRDGA
jgi:hypothetical protein